MDAALLIMCVLIGLAAGYFLRPYCKADDAEKKEDLLMWLSSVGECK